MPGRQQVLNLKGHLQAGAAFFFQRPQSLKFSDMQTSSSKESLGLCGPPNKSTFYIILPDQENPLRTYGIGK